MNPLKIAVLLTFVAILVSLAKAMFHMSSGRSQTRDTLQALTWRIGLSVFLFLLLMSGWVLGLLAPHSVGG